MLQGSANGQEVRLSNLGKHMGLSCSGCEVSYIYISSCRAASSLCSHGESEDPARRGLRPGNGLRSHRKPAGSHTSVNQGSAAVRAAVDVKQVFHSAFLPSSSWASSQRREAKSEGKTFRSLSTGLWTFSKESPSLPSPDCLKNPELTPAGMVCG